MTSLRSSWPSARVSATAPREDSELFRVARDLDRLITPQRAEGPAASGPSFAQEFEDFRGN